VTEKVESDIKASTLNESIARLESVLKEKEDVLNKHKQVEELLSESLELEKKSSELTMKEKEELREEVVALKGSFSPKLKKATLQQKLEIECLKSELERTKVELKDAQDSSIRVHEELFEEHEEMYEHLKSLPNKKRRRVLEDIYHESKKRKLEVDESDLLSESIDDAIIGDPKDDLADAVSKTMVNVDATSEEPSGNSEEASEEESVVSETNIDRTGKGIAEEDETTITETLTALSNKETFDEESLLTSTPSANKKASILFASWQNDESKANEGPGFYQEKDNLDELFDSYA